MLSGVIKRAAANISLKGQFSPQFLLRCDAPAHSYRDAAHFCKAERGSVAHCEVCGVYNGACDVALFI